MSGKYVYKNVVVASGASLSAAVDLENYELIGVRVPATVTGTSLTVKTSDSNTGTFQNYHVGAGGALSITIAGGEDIQFNPPIAVARSVKIDTGATEAAARTFVLVTRQFL